MTTETKYEVCGVICFVLVLAFLLALMFIPSGLAVCAYRPIDANANLMECR